MQLNRNIGHAPRTQSLSREVANMPAACVGCSGCQGICEALFDTMLIPDLILRDRDA